MITEYDNSKALCFINMYFFNVFFWLYVISLQMYFEERTRSLDVTAFVVKK